MKFETTLVENGGLSCRNLADSGKFLQADAASAKNF